MYGFFPHRKPCQETTWPGRQQHSSGAGCVVCQHNKRSLVSPQIRSSVPEDFLLEGSSDRPGIKAPAGNRPIQLPSFPSTVVLYMVHLHTYHSISSTTPSTTSSTALSRAARAGGRSGRRARLLETRGEHVQEEPPPLGRAAFSGEPKTDLSVP